MIHTSHNDETALAHAEREFQLRSVEYASPSWIKKGGTAADKKEESSTFSDVILFFILLFIVGIYFYNGVRRTQTDGKFNSRHATAEEAHPYLRRHYSAIVRYNVDRMP